MLRNVTEGTDLPYKAESLSRPYQLATESFFQLFHIQPSKTFIVNGNHIRTSFKHHLLFFKHVKFKHKRFTCLAKLVLDRHREVMLQGCEKAGILGVRRMLLEEMLISPLPCIFPRRNRCRAGSKPGHWQSIILIHCGKDDDGPKESILFY